MSRSGQIFDRFSKFHKENPEVWEKFKEFTLSLVFAGRKNYSADAVCHRIRWHYAIGSSGDVKINDHYTALYARMWAISHPEHKDFFRMRHRPSEKRPERPGSLDVGSNATAEIDPDLEKSLRELL